MKVSYIFILLGFLFVQCAGEERDDSKKNDPKEEETPKAVREPVKKLPNYRFLSTEMGVNEYMTMRQNDKGEKEWFYSSDKNPKDVKMGVTSKNGLHAVYFLSSPQVVYVLDLEDCGFMLTDEDDDSQWYRQIEPACGR